MKNTVYVTSNSVHFAQNIKEAKTLRHFGNNTFVHRVYNYMGGCPSSEV